MAFMAPPHAHPLASQPRAFGTGPLEALLLRIRCVHDRDHDLTDHDDPDTYRLEYALIGAYTQRCGRGLDHKVMVSTDFVEAEVIEDHYRLWRDDRRPMPVDDADRAYWLIDTYLMDWADPCDVPEDRG